MYRPFLKILGFWLLATGLLTNCHQANDEPDSRTQLEFVQETEKIADILLQDSLENYFTDLSETDIRLQMPLADTADVNQAMYQAWLVDQVLPWPDALKNKLSRLWREVLQECQDLFPELTPDTVQLLLTADEPYGPHVYFTRNRAVIMPVTDLKTDEAGLKNIFRHELFHLISREHPDLRKELYALANFVPAPLNLKWPDTLWRARLNNPDAPNYDYVLQQGQDRYLPMLFHPDPLEKGKGRERFADNIRFGYFRLQRDSITLDRLAEWKITEFSEANSAYLIHPEEIMAEHFSLLLDGQSEVAYPAELTDLKKALLAYMTSL